MPITLDVSKFSGWLNTDAPCRESRKEGIRAVRDNVRAGRREGAAGDCGARSMQGKDRLQIGGRARGGAHVARGYKGR